VQSESVDLEAQIPVLGMKINCWMHVKYFVNACVHICVCFFQLPPWKSSFNLKSPSSFFSARNIGPLVIWKGSSMCILHKTEIAILFILLFIILLSLSFFHKDNHYGLTKREGTNTGLDYWTEIFWFLHMLWLVKLIFHWLRGH